MCRNDVTDSIRAMITRAAQLDHQVFIITPFWFEFEVPEYFPPLTFYPQGVLARDYHIRPDSPIEVIELTNARGRRLERPTDLVRRVFCVRRFAGVNGRVVAVRHCESFLRELRPK